MKPPSHVANIMAARNKKSKNTETRQTKNNVQARTEIAMEQLKEIFSKEYKLGAQCPFVDGSTMVATTLDR